MVMDQWKGEVYCMVLSTGLQAGLMIIDRRTSEKEFYCLVLTPGPLAVLMVMDHQTSGKALSSGPLAVLAMDHWSNGKERSTTWSFLVVRR